MKAFIVENLVELNKLLEENRNNLVDIKFQSEVVGEQTDSFGVKKHLIVDRFLVLVTETGYIPPHKPELSAKEELTAMGNPVK